MKKLKGFTLIELIVVIAIIGILAAILLPAMLGYIRDSRLSRMNSNAKQLFNAASLALNDCYLSGGTISPGAVYTGDCSNPVGLSSSGDNTYLEDYLGKNINGYFLFVTTADDGYTCSYAYWCDFPISAGDDMGMLNKDETYATLSSSLPVGCFPLRGEDAP